MIGNLKRFWDNVHIKNDDNGYTVLLDERPVKLPQKNTLYVHNQKLAQKIAEEWQNAGLKKGDNFSFDDVPITRIVGTMIEKIIPSRETYIDMLLPYFNGDLLCYHADHPSTLVNRQKLEWLPLISWFEELLQCKLQIQYGIMPIAQDAENIKKIKQYLEGLSNEVLTAFSILIPALGSIILTIALNEKKITGEQAFQLAFLDEEIQAEIWGRDSEQEARLEKIKFDIQEAEMFMKYV